MAGVSDRPFCMTSPRARGVTPTALRKTLSAPFGSLERGVSAQRPAEAGFRRSSTCKSN